MKRQITIGPEFFAKAKNDYANWHWAIIREFMQNSMDCGSTEIDIQIGCLDGRTCLTVTNNGEPMTENILVDKLLALGASGKPAGSGNVGGFGKAKEILYFAHESYSIHTGNLLVEGSGAEYAISEDDHIDGTYSAVTITGDITDELTREVKTFAALAEWSGTLTLNGRVLKTALRKGAFRRELDLGKVYTNNSYPNTMVVRISGIPMFRTWISLDKCVVVELSADSISSMTSNRDGLRYNKSQELNGFLQELAADKSSALRSTNPSYIKFDGTSLGTTLNISGGGNARTTATPTAKDEPSSPVADAGDLGLAGSASPAASAFTPGETERGTGNRLDIEFVVKNETDMVIPEFYLPVGEFSSYSEKLAKLWARVMVEMHNLFGRKDEFAVGFVFSADCEAQHEKGPHGRVYYLNPITVVEQVSSRSLSMRKAWKLTDRDRLVMVALHEFVHGLGYSAHDEGYANKLTDMAAVVMKNRSRFMGCWRNL